MGDIYLYILFFLFGLAILDLVVGVSNDAVNFLNSAIGSKVAPLRTILIVASIGVLLGSSFSSGMMEIAQKGIFNPGLLTFEEIMVIFMAVIITDVILLDVFNTLGLPTSTTVSLVFELLGAALCVAILKTYGDTGALAGVSSYLNWSSATKIVSGIFLSVAIAFTVGNLVQLIVRFFFTFRFEERLPKIGGVFGGVAISAIVYFLLIKGLKGASFVSPDQYKWVATHTLEIVFGLFVVFGLLTQFLMKKYNINPLKTIVLAGTFSLAMAFAGNDLVNFIGVSVSGYQAMMIWRGSGLGASELLMTDMQESLQAPWFLLTGAGVIMVITLWTSSKSRKVSETEVNLARQGEGDERFQANAVSRGIVGAVLSLERTINAAMPERLKSRISHRFVKEEIFFGMPLHDQPSFDLVRASVNLMVASILIAVATSFKLPLSTTYVTFMVAMGTSLADRAWGRESAVYRVAGVINVILGWFVTAIVAFASAMLMATAIFYGGFFAIVGLVALALFLIISSNRRFKKQQKAIEEENLLLSTVETEWNELVNELRKKSSDTLDAMRRSYSIALRELSMENKPMLERMRKESRKIMNQTEKQRSKMVKFTRKLNKSELASGKMYLLLFDTLNKSAERLNVLNNVAFEHVNNYHDPLTEAQRNQLRDLEKVYAAFLKKVIKAVESKSYEDLPLLKQERDAIMSRISKLMDEQLQFTHDKKGSSRNAMLVFELYLATVDLAEYSFKVLELFHDFLAKEKRIQLATDANKESVLKGDR
ncbi:MAG: inorganic phosphate transporter [Schleiferiaceae bacterium]|nr:inorganic phosphate transporter [Schleiferiaceae bacterium]